MSQSSYPTEPTPPIGIVLSSVVLCAAPSALGANGCAPQPRSSVAIALLAASIADLTGQLRELVEVTVPKVTSDLNAALTSTRAIAGIADEMYQEVSSVSVLGSDAYELKMAAESLRDAAVSKASSKIDLRDFVPRLDDKVKQAVKNLTDSFRDPQQIATVKTFLRDAAVPLEIRCAELLYFHFVLITAVELIARTRCAEDLFLMANEVLVDKDTSKSLVAASVEHPLVNVDTFAKVAAMITATVGNLPAPDSLSVVLIKWWATHELALSTLNQPAYRADRLRAMLFNALHLTESDRKALIRKLGKLEFAVKEEALAAKKLFDAETRYRRLPGRQQSEGERKRVESVGVKADEAEKGVLEARAEVSEIRETVFGKTQRGIGVDSFISILTMLQLYASWEALRDPDDARPMLLRVTDLGASLALSGGAVTATVGKLYGLCKILEITKGLVKPLAVVGGLQLLIDGTWELWHAFHEEDGEPNTEKAIIGGVEAGAGLCITIGAVVTTGGLLLTGIGDGAVILLMGYQVVSYYRERNRKRTKVVLEARLAGLKRATVWDGRTAMQIFDLEENLQKLASTLEKWDCVDLVVDDEVAARLRRLGCSKLDFDVLVPIPRGLPVVQGDATRASSSLSLSDPGLPRRLDAP